MVEHWVGAKIEGLAAAEDLLGSVRLVTVDIDGTLVPLLSRTVAETVISAIRQLAATGKHIALITNADVEDPRYATICEIVNEAIVAYSPMRVFSPLTAACRPKPWPDLFHRAASEAGVKPSDCLHIGDQLLRDVQGATRASFRATLLVQRRGMWDAPMDAVFRRPAEKVLRPCFGYPFRVCDFPATPRQVRVPTIFQSSRTRRGSNHDRR